MLAITDHTGPWLAPLPGALASSLRDAQASSQHGGPVPTATVPRERAERTLYCLLRRSFGSHTTSATVYLLEVSHEGQPYSKGGQ